MLCFGVTIVCVWENVFGEEEGEEEGGGRHTALWYGSRLLPLLLPLPSSLSHLPPS